MPSKSLGCYFFLYIVINGYFGFNGNNMRKCNSIFLIDDSELDNYANRRLIEKLDITSDLKIFKNGLEAVNYFKILSQIDSLPDLILLDLSMPVMDGFSFLKTFRDMRIKNSEKIKIVVLSSSSSPVDIQKAQALGCDEYLEKPLSKENIREIYDKVFHDVI